ncbi:MAG: hypothetical protein AAF085_07980 [Planctomycetota bacterium]
MPEPNRVVIDRVDWMSVLPVLRLSSAFKHALQPGKLFVALIAVLLIHLSGLAFDAVLGVNESNDRPGELRAYESLVSNQANAFGGLVRSALDLEHGFGPSSQGVADALYVMVVAIPYDSFDNHPWFTLLFGIDVLFVLAIAGGILCRMAAPQVCAKELRSARQAAGFVTKRWAWFLLTPLMPALLIVLFGGILALSGLVFFNIAYLEILGSVVYGLLLLLGLLLALVSLLLVLALFLMPPALSVEGSDGFDAIARSFNYILFRPWQYAAYLIASAVYLAVVYVLIAGLIAFAVMATNELVGLGSFAVVDIGSGVVIEQPRFESVLAGGEGIEDASISTSSWIVTRWFELLTGIAIAVIFSLVCCLQTQVYILMRRSTDGTPMDEYDTDTLSDLWTEPASEATQASSDEPTQPEA